MKIHRDHWPLRLMGVLFGSGCLIVGLTGGVGVEQSDRVDFVVIAIITGLIATAGSLLTEDIIGFWYCNAKRLAARRAREARSSDLSTGS
ncbi:MAG: hypothetical protein ACR2RE_07260 [Geminicoccaceae bacterium]